ncbi:LPS-assembly protein LptD [Yoonia sp. MH D7]
MRFLFAFLLLIPTLASSQGAATLVADNVVIAGQTELIASGNIEVFYDGTRLQASQINYNQAGDELTITGPILIKTADGTIFTATAATLDPKLENGILRGARLVLNEQLQLAATQIDRADGRYSQLYKVAVTSCQVCGNQAPLWEIRAEKIVHDEAAQQLYFTNTQFLIRGVPIMWLPQVRLPDPTLERASGLLIPVFKTTDQLSTGVKIPYFITLGDSRDLTLTPYVSSATTTLEARYRQAFRNGEIEINAATSRDSIVSDNRAYVLASGTFDLARDYTLTFDVQSTSDDGYLLDYDYSDQDRLLSHVTLQQVTQNTLNLANLTYYQTLRDDEDNASLPPIIGSFSHERRHSLAAGGTLTLNTSADMFYRTSNTSGDDGRDMSRIGAQLQWSRDWISAAGLVTTARTSLQSDYFTVQDGGVNDDDGLRTTPGVGITFTYPLAATPRAGAHHLIEPTLALNWSDSYGITPPNEDSTRSEFDQANLFNATHFAGEDAIETGLRAAAGISWTRVGVKGAASTLTFGRLLRDTSSGDFNISSGLDGTASDWLVAGQYTAPNGFHVEARTLFDDNARVTRAATRLGWDAEDIQLTAAYIWQAADATESRPDAVSEWTLDTALTLTPTWSINVDTRYDLAQDEPSTAGFGAIYTNECVVVDLSVSRRYTSSTTVEPSTSYGVSVTLNGFSAANSTAGSQASCSP